MKLFNRKIELTIKEYFQIVKPKYSILQIVPDTSNRNYDTEHIAKTISNMYRMPYQRINREIKKKGFKITYQLPQKSSFMIDITKDDCKFYFIVPKQFTKLFIEKCTEAWKRATVNEIAEVPILNEGIKYQLHYSKENALSLKVNKKTNDPLNNILNVKDVMENDDMVEILHNFIPVNQRRWKGLYSETMKKIQYGFPVDKEKFTPMVMLKYGAIFMIKAIDLIFDFANDIIGDGKPIKHDEVAITMIDKLNSLSRITHNKEDAIVLDTQLLLFSNSKDNTRQQNNAYAVLEAYKTLADDNSLKYKKIDKRVNVNPLDYRIKGSDKNRMSTLECNNLLQIPGRDLMERFDIKTKVDVLENPIPVELQHGYAYLGPSTYRGKEYKAYIRDEYNFGNLALLLLSPQGGGKTTYISNLAKNCNDNHESIIILDYIKNCELAKTVKKVVRKEDVIDLDLSKKENFQGLGFNEVKINSNDEFEIFKAANMKAEQTMSFIDSINTDGLPLTSKMRRYLSAAANVVYIHNNKSIGDVIKCLQDFRKRNKYIDHISKLSEDGKNYFSDMINTLTELNDIKEEKNSKTKEVISREVVGTKDSKIDGILDRVNLIQENIYLKYMFSMSCSNNIDFVDAMENRKVILIKMPEDSFNNAMVKNVLVTFFTSKIVLATKLRGAIHEKPTRCNVFYDEIYQAPTAEHIICSVLSQLRKFGTKVIISAHYMNQLIPSLKNEIKASGASYMLLQGADKKNFDELKEELSPYELEDLLKLKQHHSLNLIKYEKGYAKFITHLPGPLVKED
jgi:replicative DNA helicase